MHLRIVSKPFSLSGKKIIFINNEELYYAKTDCIAGQSGIKLVNKKEDIILSLIIREFKLQQDSYTIRFLNLENIPIHFARSEQWKHNYEGYYQDNAYGIEKNSSGNYFITENGNTIGSWIKPLKFYLGEEDNFKISDSIKNLHLVISLCLIIHQKECDSRGPD